MAPQQVQTRNRRGKDPSVPTKKTPAIIETITLSGSDTVQIEFDTTVLHKGLPGFRTGTGDSGETVASISPVNATTVLITFTGDIAGAMMEVPEADPGIRTPAGGFVPAGNYAIPAV